MVDNRGSNLHIMNNFVKLPSGVVVNADRIEYFCGVNAVRAKGARKPSAFTFSIQFIEREDPITLSYSTKEEAELDYKKLVRFCIDYEVN